MLRTLRPCTQISLIIGTVALLLVQSEAGRVLVVPVPGFQSHLMGLKKQAVELALRGHDVAFLIIGEDANRLQPTNLSIFVYQSHKSAEPAGEFRTASGTSMRAIWAVVNQMMNDACIGLLEDAPLMSDLKRFDADVMLGDALFSCEQPLAHKLDVSWVSYWAAAPSEPLPTSLWAESPRRIFAPNPISYYPQFSMRTTTQYMSFRQRLMNCYHFWSNLIEDYMCNYKPVTDLYKRLGFDATSEKERRRLVLTMAPADWAGEWLRPLPPNFKMVGPLLAEPGKPLPAETEEFLESSGEQGVLLVAFGTAAQAEEGELAAMAAAFASLPCKVLWRLSEQEIAVTDRLSLGSNTRVMKWVPQNDVLAHPRTRAFLSHVGINSFYEAIYHGKPVLAVPYAGDQLSNADRVVAKGFGLQLSPSQLGTPAFREALIEVLTNPKYARVAQSLAVKIKARKRTPVQEAADWVEHVMETGGDGYLETPERQLSVIVRHSLDVYGLVLLLAGLSCCLLWKLAAIALFFVRRCFMARAKKEKMC